MTKYTIGYIDHDSNVHTKYLGPSLKALDGEFYVISTTSEKCPASNYNNMLSRCTTPYLILLHQDVTMPSDLLSCIDKTIKQVPDFGALGLVGVDKKKKYFCSSINHIYEVDTLDCCFIMVRKDLGVRFDDVTFDGLHQYVEDYCGQLTRSYNKHIYTIQSDGGEGRPFCHFGVTYSVRRGCWGNWIKYNRILKNKWPGIKTT